MGMSRLRRRLRRWAPLLAVLLSPAALLPGCITPPSVREGGWKSVPLRLFPPGAEEVDLPVEEGVLLRGVFAPADPGAPVVVHFLGSGDSLSLPWAGISGLAWDLRDRGYASLVLDYRGVGPSDGERSPRNLRGDARVAFAEAARRAGGEERVVVRGMSLGTLAAASVVEDGGRPAALELVCPVRAETVAVNFAYLEYWDPLVFLAAPFLRCSGDVDLVGAMRRCAAPLLVLEPDADPFLPPKEAALVRSACTEAGGRWAERSGMNHVQVYREAQGVFPEEEALLARIFPGTPPVEERVRAARAAVPAGDAPDLAPGTPAGARLETLAARRLWDPPGLAAAFALAGQEPGGEDGRARVEWLRALPAPLLRPLPFEALRALVSFQDPAGPLDARELRPMADFARRWTGTAGKPLDAAALAALAATERLGRRAEWCLPDRGTAGPRRIATAALDLDAGAGPIPADAPDRLRAAPAESFRMAVRLLLKAAGIPERPGNGPVGRPGIEAYERGAWREVELPAEPRRP